jgi:AcrR family transcriptional regulator
MSVDGVLGPATEFLLRTEPVQARSAARLSSLLDAAAQVVDEVGYERLTTAMVAERAGASIGTVYRYFPDRLAVLDGLSSRAFRQFLAAVTDRYRQERRRSLEERISSAVDVYVELYRSEPGFRVVRFGDVVDARLLVDRPSHDDVLAETLVGLAGEQGVRHEAEDSAFRIRVVIAMVESLVHRAFTSGPEADLRFVTEAKNLACDYLQRYGGVREYRKGIDTE